MSTIILLIINLAGVLSILYITSYVKRRSDINATKKDIDLLTAKVESVKYEYLKKIEEYKNELNIKYELERVLTSSKVEAYKITTLLKVSILKRKNGMGAEQELNEQIFQGIPELLIYLGSQTRISNDFRDLINELQRNYNEIVCYFDELKATGAKTYQLDIDKLVDTIDKIQIKLLE